MEQPPTLELKPLPSHLKYDYLERDGKLPIIISALLTDEKEKKLLQVIKDQRRLNPQLMEVVKKKVTKLLQAGIIYPISDNIWVSPVHVVPKKSRIIVVKNEKNELIPTRIHNS